MASAVAVNVLATVMTSSPGLTPSALSATKIASVPFADADAVGRLRECRHLALEGHDEGSVDEGALPRSRPRSPASPRHELSDTGRRDPPDGMREVLATLIDTSLSRMRGMNRMTVAPRLAACAAPCSTPATTGGLPG